MILRPKYSHHKLKWLSLFFEKICSGVYMDALSLLLTLNAPQAQSTRIAR